MNHCYSVYPREVGGQSHEIMHVECQTQVGVIMTGTEATTAATAKGSTRDNPLPRPGRRKQLKKHKENRTQPHSPLHLLCLHTPSHSTGIICSYLIIPGRSMNPERSPGRGRTNQGACTYVEGQPHPAWRTEPAREQGPWGQVRCLDSYMKGVDI